MKNNTKLDPELVQLFAELDDGLTELHGLDNRDNGDLIRECISVHNDVEWNEAYFNLALSSLFRGKLIELCHHFAEQEEFWNKLSMADSITNDDLLEMTYSYNCWEPWDQYARLGSTVIGDQISPQELQQWQQIAVEYLYDQYTPELLM